VGRIGKLAAVAVAFLGLAGAPAGARDIDIPFFGLWMISKATPAPWADPAHRTDPFLAQQWVGKKVIFLLDAIDAPPPLGCDMPDYHTVDVRPEDMFHGSLTSPIIQAQALGFRAGAPVRTLRTDCEGMIDFHFVNLSTAMFALDDVIYTLRRR
jgi:hypothetical protein